VLEKKRRSVACKNGNSSPGNNIRTRGYMLNDDQRKREHSLGLKVTTGEAEEEMGKKTSLNGERMECLDVSLYKMLMILAE